MDLSKEDLPAFLATAEMVDWLLTLRLVSLMCSFPLLLSSLSEDCIAGAIFVATGLMLVTLKCDGWIQLVVRCRDGDNMEQQGTEYFICS